MTTNIAVIGATGYTGQELVEILSKHKRVKINYLTSRVDIPTPYSIMFPRFKGVVDTVCSQFNVEDALRSADVFFLSLPHTISASFVPMLLGKRKKVIDLSADYRLDKATYEKWYRSEHKDQEGLEKAIYGLPELNRAKIKKAELIANPGCYPTSVLLGLMPAVIKKIISQDIIIDSKSGVSGAGRKADLGLSYCEVNGNFKAYKVNDHQHMPEMGKILKDIDGNTYNINFVPHLLPVNRGILSTMYLKVSEGLREEDILALYKKVYEKEPFVRVYEKGTLPELKNVVNTNYCDIGITFKNDMLVVISCIDNLVKGAAGQAVQNMNIMLGFNEKEGMN